ncbi:MAG: ABC transporter permease, partial [Methyloligellaceae bacterium]
MWPIVRMIIQRLALGLLTLFVVSVIIFASVEFLPGDIATEILGQAATPETVAQFRRELGLDKPPVTRYVDWLSGVMQGDFGKSLANQREIAELIGTRLKNTLFLAAMAAIIAVPLAVLFGVLAALYRGSFFDRAINVMTLTSISFPEFFVAYILIMIFAVSFGWFPSISNIGPETSFGDRVYRTVLPALTMTLVIMAHMMRMTRAAIINLLASPYIEMARLKGIKRSQIIVKHALPNALAPIINVIALNLAYLVVGVVLVEVVFVYPGLGPPLVDSVTKRDITVVQASSLVFAATYIILNLLADVLSILTNPRL